MSVPLSTESLAKCQLLGLLFLLIIQTYVACLPTARLTALPSFLLLLSLSTPPPQPDPPTLKRTEQLFRKLTDGDGASGDRSEPPNLA